MSHNSRRLSDAYGSKESQPDSSRGRERGLSDRIHLPLENRLERHAEQHMEYPTSRRNYQADQQEYHPPRTLDDRIGQDYRPPKGRGYKGRREEPPAYKDRNSNKYFEDRIVVDYRTLEDRISVAQSPSHKKNPTYDGKPSNRGNGGSKGTKVQPTGVKSNNFTELGLQDGLQDEDNSGNRDVPMYSGTAHAGGTQVPPDDTITVQKNTVDSAASTVIPTSERVTMALQEQLKISRKLRQKALQSIKKKQIDDTKEGDDGINGKAGEFNHLVDQATVQPMVQSIISPLEQNVTGPMEKTVPIAKVQANVGSDVAVDAMLAEAPHPGDTRETEQQGVLLDQNHLIKQNKLSPEIQVQEQQKLQLLERQTQERQHEETTRRQHESLPEEKEKEEQEAERQKQEVRQQKILRETALSNGQSAHLSDTPIQENQNGQTAGELHSIFAKKGTEPFSLGEKDPLLPGKKREELDAKQISLFSPVPSDSTAPPFTNLDKDTQKNSLSATHRRREESHENMECGDKMPETSYSTQQTTKPSQEAPQEGMGALNEPVTSAEVADSRQYPDQSNTSNLQFQRKDSLKSARAVTEKVDPYMDGLYRDNFYRAPRDEDRERQYASHRPEYIVPARVPPSLYAYHSQEYPGTFSSRYIPIRDEISSRRLELDYDPYYKDLPEWLEMTGFHDLEFRQISLRRHREKEMERYYQIRSGDYRPHGEVISLPYEPRVYRNEAASVAHVPATVKDDRPRISPEGPGPVTSRVPAPYLAESNPVKHRDEKPPYGSPFVAGYRISPPPSAVALKRRNPYQEEEEERIKHRPEKAPRFTSPERPRKRSLDKKEGSLGGKKSGFEPEASEFSRNRYLKKADHGNEYAIGKEVSPPEISRNRPYKSGDNKGIYAIEKSAGTLERRPSQRYHIEDSADEIPSRGPMKKIMVRPSAPSSGPILRSRTATPEPPKFNDSGPNGPKNRREGEAHIGAYKPYGGAITPSPPDRMRQALIKRDQKGQFHPTSPEHLRKSGKGWRGNYSKYNTTPRTATNSDYDFESSPQGPKQFFKEPKQKQAKGRGRGGFTKHIHSPDDHSNGYRNRYQKPPTETDDAEIASPHLPVNSDTRYFIVKSWNLENVLYAQKEGIWATQTKNSELFEDAFNSARDVILIFSVNKSGRFQGYARMESAPGTAPMPKWGDQLLWKSSGAFYIRWITICDISFHQLVELRNRLNEDQPVFVGRDGQEIEPECGAALCGIVDDRATYSA